MNSKKILHSKILGQGNPLFILHGLFGMGDNWKTIGNTFSKSHQVHIIDQRNHGRSFHSDEFSYKDMVEDLERYIDYYELEKISLLGHSMGGKTAMFFAIENQEKLENLVVADISPKVYSMDYDKIITALNRVDFSKQPTRKAVDKSLQEYIYQTGIREFLLKNVYWREKGVLDYRFNLESLSNNIKKLGEALPYGSVYKGKTLFIRGGKSNYISEKDSLSIRNHFPKAIIRTLSESGHWLHVDQPKQFLEIVQRFLIK